MTFAYLPLDWEAKLGHRVDMTRCRAAVHGLGVSFVQCPNKGRHEENGMLWCGVHLPSKVAEKARKRDEAFRAKRAAEDRRWKHRDELREARNKVVEVAKLLVRQQASYEDLDAAVSTLERIEAENEG